MSFLQRLFPLVPTIFFPNYTTSPWICLYFLAIILIYFSPKTSPFPPWFLPHFCHIFTIDLPYISAIISTVNRKATKKIQQRKENHLICTKKVYNPSFALFALLQFHGVLPGSRKWQRRNHSLQWRQHPGNRPKPWGKRRK